jgi:hypothetical protein
MKIIDNIEEKKDNLELIFKSPKKKINTHTNIKRITLSKILKKKII